jgi:hypothetical protein
MQPSSSNLNLLFAARHLTPLQAKHDAKQLLPASKLWPLYSDKLPKLAKNCLKLRRFFKINSGS